MPQYNGVWTLEAQAQAQSNQQWVTDPNFKNTTLLLQADNAANGATNNLFLDSSTNGFAITRNGNTTQGSFSPFSQAPGYWGNYFGGASDYLTGASNAALVFGTGTYTIEMWVYQTARSGTQFILGGGGGFQLGINSTGFLFGSVAGVGDLTAATIAIQTNTWTHIAVVRNSTSSGGVAYYINGSAAGTATDATNYTSNVTLNVGTTNGNAGVTPLSGYLSNVRVVKGTNVYTSAFTPSTAPLTAITNTSLLTCQNNRFVDNSTNALALSTSGAPSVQAFGPFAPALQWTPDVVGGSAYFDGTGDYLNLPVSQTPLLLGNSDFSFEGWVYWTATAARAVMFGGQNDQASAAGSSYFFAVGTSGTIDVYIGSTNYGLNVINPSLNTWAYVVYARTGGTLSSYLNGTRISTRSDLSTGSINNGSTTYPPQIGADGNGKLLTGYMSGLRLIKGSGGYDATQSTITIPTVPPTAVANTSLLTNFTNAGIYDGKMASNFETVGDARVATNPVKYGSGSMYFDGTGDGLVGPVSNLFDFGSGDFTVEFWANIPSTSGNGYFVSVWETTGGSDSNSSWLIRLNNNGTLITHLTQGSGTFNQLTSAQLPTNTWFHCAYTRAANTIYLFINGVLSQSAAVSGAMNTVVRPLRVGYQNGGNPLNGYIDDLRITKGVCRYIANFTPPQQALPRQ